MTKYFIKAKLKKKKKFKGRKLKRGRKKGYVRI